MLPKTFVNKLFVSETDNWFIQLFRYLFVAVWRFRYKVFEGLKQAANGRQLANFQRLENAPCGMRKIFEKSYNRAVKASRQPRFIDRSGAPE